MRNSIEPEGPMVSEVGTPARPQKLARYVLPPDTAIEIETRIDPMPDPIFVDRANVPVNGKVRRSALSIASSIRLTDCTFESPIDAFQAGRFQRVEAKGYRLRRDSRVLFPD